MKQLECAEAYLERAQLCRELADEVASPEVRWDLEAVALQYELLADHAYTLAESKPRYP